MSGPPAKVQAGSDAAAAKPEPQKPVAYGAAAMTDLEEEIKWDGCELLNSNHSLVNVLKQGQRDQSELVVQSDADEQLLLTIRFKTAVKVHSLLIDGRGANAPKEVKVFANARNGFDFSDAESGAATQEFDFSPESLGQRLETKFVKFQNVESLTIFVASNQSDGEEDETVLSRVQLWGCTLQTTKMGEFKRVAGEAGEGE